MPIVNHLINLHNNGNKIKKIYITAINLNFVVNSYKVLDKLIIYMIKDFNNYSKERGLNINLSLTYFSDLNNTKGYSDYDLTLSLLGKKHHKYDMFLYDMNYLKIYAPYLLELENYLPKKCIDLYSSENNNKLTVYNEHRLGLYYERYNIKIPKTWDELIETSNYVLNNERIKYNNTELVGYNGLFPNNENSVCSLYQILYSYRETKDSPLPEFTSQAGVDALNKLLEIKNKISSYKIFSIDEVYLLEQMYSDNILFVNFYSSLQIDTYITSPLPGKKEGINGSILGGYNIGINKNISEKRQKASIKVMEYFFSKNFQKDIVVKKFHFYSPIVEIYNDKNVCSVIDCKIIKESQFFIRPSSTMKNYNNFSKKVIKNMLNYLEGKKSIEEVLTNIDDINRIYYFTVKSIPGFIMFSLLLILFITVILSTSLLFLQKYCILFRFFSLDLWFMYTMGSVLMILSNVFYFEETTVIKCFFRQILKEFGNALIFIPILYKLLKILSHFRKKFKWIQKYKFRFILSLLSIHILFSILIIIFDTYKVKTINDMNDKNSIVCQYNKIPGIIVFLLQIAYNILLYVIVCILIFQEWNLKIIPMDLKPFTFTMIIDGINHIISSVFYIININNYIVNTIVHIYINFLYIFINHIYIFIIRVLLTKKKFPNENNRSWEDKLVKNVLLSSETSSNVKNTITFFDSDSDASIIIDDLK
ncbi:hypothetical protein U3516DRAFT_622772 [Neocallimastix sp. 'constans']